MAPATRLAAISHCLGAAPATSRRVRRSQSPGASRNTSPRWPSTWMVMAPNHSTKLALCTVSSSGSHEEPTRSNPTPLASSTTVRITTAGPSRRSSKGGAPLRW